MSRSCRAQSVWRSVSLGDHRVSRRRPAVHRAKLGLHEETVERCRCAELLQTRKTLSTQRFCELVSSSIVSGPKEHTSSCNDRSRYYLGCGDWNRCRGFCEVKGPNDSRIVLLPWTKKKSSWWCISSCGIKESVVCFRCDASMREVVNHSCKSRSLSDPQLNQAPWFLARRFWFMHQQHGYIFFSFWLG